MAIDTQVPEWEHLVAAAIHAEQFVLYDGENDTLGDVLLRTTEGAAYSGNKIASLSILSHGRQGRFSLGNERVSTDNLAKTAHHWLELGRHMSDGANIYIFGCGVASPSADGQLVDALADLTGADIFASDDLTGAGGDWDLEVASRGAEAELAAGLEMPFDVDYLAGYAATLADYNETLWSGTDTFIDDGISFTLSVTGGGTIDWSYNGDNDTLTISDNDGTSPATSVTITINEGVVNIDGITLDTDLGSLVSNVDIGTINIADNQNIAAVTVAGGSGTIDTLNYAGGVDSNITIDGNVGAINTVGYIDGNITITGDLGSLDTHLIWAGAIVDIGGDAGTITVNLEASTCDDLAGELIVGGNLTALVVGDSIDGSVTVGGTIGSITTGASINGSITGGGDVGAINTINMCGTIDITGSVTSITSAGWTFNGDITVTGDLGSLDTYRILPGAIVDIGGDAGTITFDCGGSTCSDMVGELIVGGNLTALVVGDDIENIGSVAIGGTVGSITVGSDIYGTIDVTGSVTSITAGALVTSDITIGGDLDSFSAGTNCSGLLTADLVIGLLDIVDGATEFHPTYDDTTRFVYDGSIDSLNAAPTVNDQTFAIDENSANGTVVDTVIASDPDAGDSLTYSITAGNTDNAFAINPATGQITVNNQAALDFETNPTFSLTVQVEDTEAMTDTAAVMIDLNNLNEAPVINDQSVGVAENLPDSPVFPVPQELSPLVFSGLPPFSLSVSGAFIPVIPGSSTPVMPTQVSPAQDNDIPDKPEPDDPESDDQETDGLGSNDQEPDDPESNDQETDDPESNDRETDDRIEPGTVKSGGDGDVAPIKQERNLDQLKAESPSIVKSVMANKEMSRQLELMKQKMDQAADSRGREDNLVVGVATSTSVLSIAGYALWLFRGGSPFAGLLSTAPMWKRFDPLPILESRESRRGKHKPDKQKDSSNHRDGDEETEAMFER